MSFIKKILKFKLYRSWINPETGLLIMKDILFFKGNRRIRRMMRGYRYLKKSNQLNKIQLVKEALTNTVLNVCQGRVSRYVFGAATSDAELALRQYLLLHIGGLGFNKSLLYALGKENAKIIHPLPSEWQDVLSDHGLKVAKFRSTFIWYCYILLLFLYGIICFIRHLYKNLINIVKNIPNDPSQNYAYFYGITKSNIPSNNKSKKKYDIISWYCKSIGDSKKIDSIFHSVSGIETRYTEGVPVNYQPLPIPFFSSYRELVSFSIYTIFIICYSFLDIFRGRWWHALILKDTVFASSIRFLKHKKLASEYMFSNSSWFYRPLWTYEAEKAGSKISFYFYSTNVEQFRRSDGSKGITYGWQAANWPHYLVWDTFQIDFIRETIDTNASIEVVGNICFNSAEEELIELPSNTIAVFDVQHARDSFFQILGADSDYYTPFTSRNFLVDIYEILKEKDITLALKRKRRVDSSIHPKYKYLIKEFKKKSHYIEIDPDVAVHRLIEESHAVISMPFTSTALIGRELNKPSIYYDASASLDKNKFNNIQILKTKNELKNWYKSL